MPPRVGPIGNTAKRAFDILGALGLLVFLAPLLLIVAALIRLEDGGPILFHQKRTGLNGVVFTILKFRSMAVAEEGDLVRQATKGDQRVTRIGRVIRTLSVDELPQLLNILRGEMSFVGPRPHALSHDEAWSALSPSYGQRFRARPGLSGYAQVLRLRGEVTELADVMARIDADNHYIDNWSLGLEISIILRTIPLIFWDSKAY